MNILTPVGSMARLIPFHDASIVYFWRAVSGKRGSGADGGGCSFGVAFEQSDFVLAASFPSSQPISAHCTGLLSASFPYVPMTFT